ncbi:AraC family transcriptional regulator [Actibacterium lipolyticum]|uniref:Arabinose operon regulatory protein n=1 Tax=Actibacterium lipolyticum TaxID=1524263 RepID=A0A238JXR4_9RHOB|nr:AraC family transcriptional regulator [Actibacterium lipolyticum]SMX34934.1 Arabinose operon regulatory protein [Actibacterium lipolyticum]
MQEQDLRLIPINRLMQGGRWRVEAMRSYSVDQLLWFTRGQGRLTVGGVTRGYGAHNAVFIPARTMHAFELGAQVFGTAVFFSQEHTLPLPKSPCHLRIRDTYDQQEVTAILDHLQRESEEDRPARLRAMHHYAGILSVWLERQMLQHDDALATVDASRRLARRYSELVENEFHTGRSVADYAAALSVTPTHLTRVCKSSCGTTASDFLADRKIAEARRMLADTKLPVNQIALGLGFTSPAYFSRAFQSRTGLTPGAFRRSS